MPAVVTPLAPARYKVEFTASAELRDKLERLRALMRSSVPDGDLGAIIEEAVTEKLERLESKRFGKTKTPRKSLKETKTSPSSRYIPAAVRRAVHKRDKSQCTYIAPNGRRCTERHRLEFHHAHAYGKGGNHSPSNVFLVCRTHNSYLAELDYGKAVIERHRKNGRAPSRVREPAAVYTYDNRTTRSRRVVQR
jgi:5-methylcytosine-specific restriction endonuclease McrA